MVPFPILILLLIALLSFSVLKKPWQLTTARVLLLIWSLLFLFGYAGWIALFGLGPTGFDGEPNPLVSRMGAAVILIVSIFQIALSVRILLRETKAALWALIIPASVLCLVYAGASGFNFGLEGALVMLPAGVNLIMIGSFAVPRLMVWRRMNDSIQGRADN